MKIYSVGGGLWPIFIGLALFLLIIIGIGGLLLGTPLGLALLALWAVSSIYKRWQIKRHFNQQQQGQYTYWQGDGSRATEEDPTWAQEEASTVVNDEFAKYREEASEHRAFSVNDRRNAEDVDFKEI